MAIEATGGQLARTPRRPGSTPVVFAVVAVMLAGLVGVALAANPPAGVALVAILLFAPLAMRDLRTAIALWLPLIFLGAVPAMNAAGKAAGLLLAVAWLGAIADPRRAAAASALVQRHRRLLELLALMLVWLSLSLLWAASPARVLADLWHWFAIALLWFVLATTLDTPRAVRLAAGLFVAGALMSVAFGVTTGNLTASGAAAERLEGAAGDPNFLAASLVASIVLAAALCGTVTSALARGALAVAIPLLAVGLVLSQSRGGVLTALCTIVISLVVFRGRRGRVVAFALPVLAMAAVMFAANPDAVERITGLDGSGSGRTSLWTVAWRVAADQPITGAGLNNFVEVAGGYVREPGALERVRLIAESPHFVHNLYLHVFAETGVIGLLLYVAFAIGALAAAFRAARRFEALGDGGMQTLARAVGVAGISMLISSVFLSSQVDQRLWVLFALGPALLAAAHGQLARRSA